MQLITIALKSITDRHVKISANERIISEYFSTAVGQAHALEEKEPGS